MNIDTIATAFRTAWAASGGSVPAARAYYDRAQQPSGLSGFPYLCFRVSAESPEIVGQYLSSPQLRLCTYTLTIEFYTVQGMPGTSGDQITDQGNLMRAAESVLSNIPANQPWYGVTNFIRCLQEGSTLEKDQELYLGKDVMMGTMEFSILVQE